MLNQTTFTKQFAFWSSCYSVSRSLRRRRNSSSVLRVTMKQTPSPDPRVMKRERKRRKTLMSPKLSRSSVQSPNRPRNQGRKSWCGPDLYQEYAGSSLEIILKSHVIQCCFLSHSSNHCGLTKSSDKNHSSWLPQVNFCSFDSSYAYKLFFGFIITL